ASCIGKSPRASAILDLSPVPIEPVGQATKARSAARSSSELRGWVWTHEYSPASRNVAGASCRQVAQSMQLEPTKKEPSTLSSTRNARSAILQDRQRMFTDWRPFGEERGPPFHGQVCAVYHGMPSAPFRRTMHTCSPGRTDSKTL